MNRREWTGAAVLVLVVLAVGLGLWAKDQPARTPTAGPVSEAAAGPAVRAGSVLTTMPGTEGQAAENPAVVTCRTEGRSAGRLRRAMKIAAEICVYTNENVIVETIG